METHTPKASQIGSAHIERMRELATPSLQQPAEAEHGPRHALGMPRLAAGPAEAAVAEGRAEGLHHGRLLRRQLRGQEQRGAHEHPLLLAQLPREAHIDAHQQVALPAACTARS